jgi:CheY-like chemotaxis protein
LWAARLRSPDLITSEVQLAPGCGIDAVEEICRDRVISVVFITGIARDVQFRLLGHVVVNKPFGSDQLAQAVRRAVT